MRVSRAVSLAAAAALACTGCVTRIGSDLPVAESAGVCPAPLSGLEVASTPKSCTDRRGAETASGQTCQAGAQTAQADKDRCSTDAKTAGRDQCETNTCNGGLCPNAAECDVIADPAFDCGNAYNFATQNVAKEICASTVLLTCERQCTCKCRCST